MLNCVSPPALDDSQLLASLDGEADEQVAEHLARCPYCRERAAQLGRLQNRLTARLYRLTCPTPLELGEYHLGLLRNEQKTAIAAHLRECPHCMRELAELKTYLSELAPPLEPSPVDRVKVLIARLFGERMDGQQPGTGSLAPAFAMLRGGSSGPITLEADGILIVLDAQPSDEARLAITGQIAAEDQDRWTGASIELRQGEALRCTAAVNDLGAFRCAGILPGFCVLQIKPLDGPVILANFEVSL